MQASTTLQRIFVPILFLLGVQGAAAPAAAQPAGEAASSPSAEEIVARSIEARGGLEAWRQVGTVRMKGTISHGGGGSVPLSLEFKRPSKVRVDFEVEGRPGIQAFDGETAWAVISFQGGEPIRLSQDQRRELKEQADFEGPFIGYREKGYEIELAGTTAVEGRKLYLIELRRGGGEVSEHGIDAETFLEVRQSVHREVEGQDLEITVRLGDYREVGGLKVPFRIEQSLSIAPAPQIIQLEEVELGVELPDERFAFPEG